MSLGLGLPFLLYSALSGEPTETENYETVVTIGVAVSIAVGVCVLLSRDDRLRNDAAWRRPRQPRARPRRHATTPTPVACVLEM